MVSCQVLQKCWKGKLKECSKKKTRIGYVACEIVIYFKIHLKYNENNFLQYALGVKRIHRNPDRSGSAEDPFESSKIRGSADPKKKKKKKNSPAQLSSLQAWLRPVASTVACVDLARSTAARSTTCTCCAHSLA